MKVKTGSTKYVAIHAWLKKMYGRANKCERIKCPGITKIFDWAKKIDKEYDFNRENFEMLCRSCHRKQDYKINPKGKNKKSFFKIVRNLYQLRTKLGWTQTVLAKSINRSQATIVAYEKGERIPLWTMKALKDIAYNNDIEFMVKQ